jgi:hypothetical protein
MPVTLTHTSRAQVAIAKEVPAVEMSLEDAEKELRKLRLAPILFPYELRCFWCTYRFLGSQLGAQRGS